MTEENEQAVQNRTGGQVFLDIIKFIGFVLLSLVPVQMIITLMLFADHFSTTTNIILGIICFILIILIIMYLWNRHFKYSKEKLQKIRLRDLGFAFLFFFITRVIAVVGTLLITWLYGEEMTANDEAIMELTDHSNTFALYFILFVLALGILGPIAEELAYRGIGTHLLFKKGAFWLPLIITSSIFGLMHTPTNIISFLLYGLMGVIFFLAYHRRKNILDSILVHMFNNGISAIVLLVAFIMDAI